METEALVLVFLPGGVHLGILPPAGLREAVGFEAVTVDDEGGLTGADLADGGVLTEGEAPVRQNYFYINNKVKKEELKLCLCLRDSPEACSLQPDAFDGCFCFLDAGVFFIFSFFLVLLTFFTVNSSSSLSAGSL